MLSFYKKSLERLMPTMPYLQRFKSIAMALMLVLNANCGSVKPPVEKLVIADQMLKQADANEAGLYAPLEFRLASEKLEQAKLAMEKEDYLVAERLADHAAIDARTALAKADAMRAKKTVDELKESIEILRQEIKSKANH